jgi:hypothetical protein
VHFDYRSLFSDAQSEKVGNPKKYLKTVEKPKKPKYQKIEPNP